MSGFGMQTAADVMRDYGRRIGRLEVRANGAAAAVAGGGGAGTNSPAFTGVPTAPTPDLADSSGALATTAFVKGQGYLSSGALGGYATQSWVGQQGYLTQSSLSGYAKTTDISGKVQYRGAWVASTAYAVNDMVTAGGASWVCAVAHTSGSVFSGGSNWSALTPGLTSYAPLAGPAFTGTPTAPTPSTADSSTKLATTAYVQAQGYLTSSALSGYATQSWVNQQGYALASALTPLAPLASPALTGTPTAPTATAGDSSTKLATTAFVKAQGYITSSALTPLAPLASPALTGTPTAPTATAGDSTTAIATTAFVKAAVDAVAGVDLTQYAKLASPAFSGAPTAPTPATGDSSTALATTAFVAAQGFATQGFVTGQGYAKLSSPAFTDSPTAPTPGALDNSGRIATTSYIDNGRLGLVNQDISSQDLNNILTTGLYRGSPLGSSPTGGTDWYWVLVQSHDRNAWISQTAWGYTGAGNGRMYWRFRNNGNWSGWNEVSSTADAQSRADTAQTNAQNWTQSYFVQKSGDTMSGQLTVNNRVAMNDLGWGSQGYLNSSAIQNRTETVASTLSGTGSTTTFVTMNVNGTLGHLSGSPRFPSAYSDNITTRAVYVGSTGQLGTTSSSRRTKNLHQHIRMDDTALEAWLGLDTWEFDYKADPEHKAQYGLVAEEVDEAGYQWLVYYDENPESDTQGQIDGFAYEKMGVMNRMAIQRLYARLQAAEGALATLQGQAAPSATDPTADTTVSIEPTPDQGATS